MSAKVIQMPARVNQQEQNRQVVTRGANEVMVVPVHMVKEKEHIIVGYMVRDTETLMYRAETLEEAIEWAKAHV